MTRKECLEQAMGCVLRDRASQYGGPEDNFGRIAKLWSTYTGTVLDGIDVAMMMALLKVARIRNNKDYSDGYIDLAGYAACGAELAGRAEAYRQSIEKAGAEYKRLRDEAEGGCCQNENGHSPEASAEPEFQRGDKVQCRVTLPSVSDRIWVDGEYVRYEKGRSRPHVVFTRAALELVSDGDIRPAPKAEGCEDLVFDEARMRESMPSIVPQDGPSDFDAPQTAQELYRRIIANNPATFKARTPTGEELAEMAEEEGNG